MLSNVIRRPSLPFKRVSEPSQVRRYSKRSARGVTIIEFVGLSVVLVTLLLGIVEFARAWFFAGTVSHAAREGCRVAILPASTEADVLTAVARFINVPNGDVIMQNVGLYADSGDETVVEITYNLDVATGTLIPGWSGTVPIKGRAVMRHE